MDRRTRNVFAIALVVLVVVTGGAAVLFGGGGIQPPQPTGSGSFMVGVIVAVDGEDLDDVRGFSIRRNGDGAIVEFGLAELQNGTEFPPGHLAEHQVTAEPVRVHYRDEGGTLQAIRVDDAS